MSKYKLDNIANKMLNLASTVPRRNAFSGTVTDQLRQTNTAIENLLAAGIGYALPLPQTDDGNPKAYFANNYGTTVTMLVSAIGEQRILNSEVLAVAISTTWLYRYAQAHDVSLLQRLGLLEGGRIAGLGYLEDYTSEYSQGNYSTLFAALEQIGKLALEQLSAVQGVADGNAPVADVLAVNDMSTEPVPEVIPDTPIAEVPGGANV